MTKSMPDVRLRSFLQNAGFGTKVAAFGLSTPAQGADQTPPGRLSSQGLGLRARGSGSLALSPERSGASIKRLEDAQTARGWPRGVSALAPLRRRHSRLPASRET